MSDGHRGLDRALRQPLQDLGSNGAGLLVGLDGRPTRIGTLGAGTGYAVTVRVPAGQGVRRLTLTADSTQPGAAILVGAITVPG